MGKLRRKWHETNKHRCISCYTLLRALTDVMLTTAAPPCGSPGCRWRLILCEDQWIPGWTPGRFEQRAEGWLAYRAPSCFLLNPLTQRQRFARDKQDENIWPPLLPFFSSAWPDCEQQVKRLLCVSQIAEKPDYDKVRKAISELIESEKAEDYDDGKSLPFTLQPVTAHDHPLPS